MNGATRRLALLITGLLVLKPSPDAPDKDLKPGIGLGSHRSPKTYYHNRPFNQIIFLYPAISFPL